MSGSAPVPSFPPASDQNWATGNPQAATSPSPELRSDSGPGEQCGARGQGGRPGCPAGGAGQSPGRPRESQGRTDTSHQVQSQAKPMDIEEHVCVCVAMPQGNKTC